jgi:hypothetical protein
VSRLDIKRVWRGGPARAWSHHDYSRFPASRSIHQRPQLSLILHPLVPKHHDIHQDVVLPELLAQLDQTVLSILNGRSDKRDDALPLVLVLAVFQGELGYGEGGGEVGDAPDGRFAEGGEKLAEVVGGCDEEGGAASGASKGAQRAERAGERTGARRREREQEGVVSREKSAGAGGIKDTAGQFRKEIRASW